jgi:CHAT domain-containing protein
MRHIGWRHLRRQDNAAALVRAQRELLTGSEGAFLHPSHWAGFVLVGDAH